MLERRCYDEARRRYDYVLTDKGKALWPVLVTLRQWGDTWVLGEGNEPVAMVHTGCGGHTTGSLTCDRCNERLERRDVRIVAGPGLEYPGMLPTHQRGA